MQNKILLQKLDEINAVLKNESVTTTEFGLFGGHAGIALFQFYYAKFSNTDSAADAGAANIAKVVNEIGNTFRIKTYCDGIAGFGWVLDHLEENGCIENDNDEMLQQLDSYVYQEMISDIKQGNYDFLHGALGYGFYFFKRYRCTKSDELRDRYKKYLIELIGYLSTLAEVDKNGLKWQSSIKIGASEKHYNFSLSHGMASIVNFLSRLHVYDDFKNETAPLLHGSICFIKSFLNTDSSQHFLFPSTVNTGEPVSYNARLAWCYGDLGIGVSFWHAAKALNDDTLKHEAVQILKHAAALKSIEQTGVKDAMLCHGSFGIAQIFNSMYKESNEVTFRTATEFWINDGLERAIHKDGYAGFKMRIMKAPEWRLDVSVLNGIAGIGLSIMSYISGDHSWDECLMIG